eukprot:6499692-Prymnesium_polylepis.1
MHELRHHALEARVRREGPGVAPLNRWSHVRATSASFHNAGEASNPAETARAERRVGVAHHARVGSSTVCDQSKQPGK